MSLKNWRDNGWLTDHKTSPQEISDLLSVAERDLRDSSASGLSTVIQLFLDLYNYPIRGLEQAEHLYEKRLKNVIEF